MNASIQTRTAHAACAVAAVITQTRREARSRDFGIGYGHSSGYSSQRRYSASGFSPRFRCS